MHTYQRFILKYPKLIREYVFALLLIRNKCPVFSLTHNTHPPLRTTENNISSKWSKYLMDCGFYHITDYIRLYTFYAWYIGQQLNITLLFWVIKIYCVDLLFGLVYVGFFFKGGGVFGCVCVCVDYYYFCIG